MKFTLKQSISATMLILGLSGILLLVFSEGLYREFAYEHEQVALSKMTGLEMSHLIQNLDRNSRELGSFLQEENEVRSAMKHKDLEAITLLLNDQFYQYYTTAEILKIARIYAYDENFNLLTESTEGQLNITKGTQLCPNILELASRRKGSERVKMLSDTCAHNGLGYYAVLVPVGGLVPNGYLIVVTDPVYNLIAAEKDMESSIIIKQPDNEIAYKSKSWPTSNALDNYIYAEYSISNKKNEKTLTLAITQNIETFRIKLQQTLNIILVIAILVFIPAIAAALLLIRRAFKPLEDLRNASSELSSGNYVTIQESKFPEINSLINSFNLMSGNISSLVEELEVENLQRKKVQESLKENQHNLEIARDEALQATKAKSNFLANMSHEIRTPLTAIIGFSRILQKKKIAEDKKQKAIQTIINNSEHLLNIINDILDISKIEANKLEISKSNIDFFHFMQDFNSYFIDTVDEKNINFEIKYNYPLPKTIVSDEVRLKQIIINLLSNAKKFTDHGHIYICVFYDSEKNTLHFEVEDTGIGLTEQQAAKIFSEFTQADSSITKKYGGTGLGLSISRQLVEKLGGKISVESKSNKGSTFKFYLDPGVKDDLTFCETKQEFESEYLASIDAFDDSLVQGNILLVEDIVDNQVLISSYLEDMGCHITIANNGREAIDVCENNQFDLILMDMQMPIMGGVEAIETLRERNYRGAIAMLTANAFENDKQRCLKAGCNDFLVKPIDIRVLRKTVNKYLPSSTGSFAKIEETPKLLDDNEDYIISTMMGYSEKRDALVQNFISKLPDFLNDLTNAYAVKDISKIKTEAHRLKGVGGNYGYGMITEICAEIEFDITNNQIEHIQGHLNELISIAIKINQGFEAYQNSID